jgi:hypothetical protein
MNTITKEELSQIISKHVKWLRIQTSGERADLRRADLSDADLSAFQIVPETGQFYAFKKLDTGIATLLIPRSAKRTSSLIGRKCRASKVKVISIMSNAGKPIDMGVSPTQEQGKLIYKVGKWVTADEFDDDVRVECTNGIHYFMTKKEAEEY